MSPRHAQRHRRELELRQIDVLQVADVLRPLLRRRARSRRAARSSAESCRRREPDCCRRCRAFIRSAPRPPAASRARNHHHRRPASGWPSEPITVPEIRDRRAGTSGNATELNSWPSADRHRLGLADVDDAGIVRARISHRLRLGATRSWPACSGAATRARCSRPASARKSGTRRGRRSARRGPRLTSWRSPLTN